MLRYIRVETPRYADGSGLVGVEKGAFAGQVGPRFATAGWCRDPIDAQM